LKAAQGLDPAGFRQWAKAQAQAAAAAACAQ
jgi:hypothetical protein